MTDRIPVSIITGFLGAGKTTLLNRLLREPAMSDTAVIINEFGEIGLDHLLVARPAENMVVLDGGCICCTVRGDLVGTLNDLHARRTAAELPPFNRVLVETTGLADPVPILQTLITDPELAQIYRLQDVITMVDGLHGHAQLDRNPESVKQAAVADTVLITKRDLAGEPALAELSARLTSLNPGAVLHVIERGMVPPDLLFSSPGVDAAATAAQLERWLNHRAYVSAPGPARFMSRGSPAHDDGIRAFSIYRDEPVSAAGLTLWLQSLAGLRGANLLRFKGLLNVDGRPIVVQAVQTIIHEPVELEAWPDDDRRSRLVFITRDMERIELERTLDALDYAPDATPTPRIDPQAYARFVQALQGFADTDKRATEPARHNGG
jgi:G3E family GTPase